MVVGGEGVVLTSTDGLRWSLQQTGTNSLFGVSWSGSEFTAIGNVNTILPFARPWGDDKLLTLSLIHIEMCIRDRNYAERDGIY